MPNSIKRLRRPVAAAAVVLCCASIAPAQQRPFVTGFVGGVSIDAAGMVREAQTLEKDELLPLLTEQAVKPAGGLLRQASPLRKISLARLEREVARLHRSEEPLPAEVRLLAGLTSVKYVFFSRSDAILAGPAEPWEQAAGGEIVGAQSGRPVLHLDDLLVALRFAAGVHLDDAFLGCSIEPTPDGVARVNRLLRQIGGRIGSARLSTVVESLQQALGPQEIRLYGAPPSSRLATTMVAADYRLKRVALGHDPSRVEGVPSYLDLAARRGGPAARRQHRWWFRAHYDAIYHTPERTAFALVGRGLRVVAAASAAGDQDDQGQPASPAAKAFAEAFTERFDELAATRPVFAELQNLVALAVAAEIVLSQNPASTSEPTWRPAHFLDEGACPLVRYHVPRRSPPLANLRRMRNRQWLVSISGGVEIDPAACVNAHLRSSDDEALARLRRSKQAAATHWWWD